MCVCVESASARRERGCWLYQLLLKATVARVFEESLEHCFRIFPAESYFKSFVRISAIGTLVSSRVVLSPDLSSILNNTPTFIGQVGANLAPTGGACLLSYLSTFPKQIIETPSDVASNKISVHVYTI